MPARTAIRVGAGVIVVMAILGPAIPTTGDSDDPRSDIEALRPAVGGWDEPDWGPRLGYPEGSVVVILHADDLGLSPAVNRAAARLLSQGHIQSASIMMPCAAAGEAVAWCVEHPEADTGLHATLTSEWKSYRWGPLLGRSEVPGLFGPDGRLWRTVAQVERHATANEVEREVREQLERGLAAGWRPTHMDSHMTIAYARRDFFQALVRVAVDHGLAFPVVAVTPDTLAVYLDRGRRIDAGLTQALRSSPLPKLRSQRGVAVRPTYEATRSAYVEMIRSLEPGLHYIYSHPAEASERMAAVTPTWKNRTWDAALFADAEVHSFYATQRHLRFATWREVMERYRRWSVRSAAIDS
jgi:hypothetical protein